MGVPIVARAIAELREDPAVRQCLQALFSYELENAELKMPAFNEKYDKEIEKYAKAWMPPVEEGERP